jgi:hypothetical protein
MPFHVWFGVGDLERKTPLTLGNSPALGEFAYDPVEGQRGIGFGELKRAYRAPTKQWAIMCPSSWVMARSPHHFERTIPHGIAVNAELKYLSDFRITDICDRFRHRGPSFSASGAVFWLFTNSNS